MISTGVVRKLDALGRIVIPKEVRESINITEKDPMEILIKGEHIILRKYQSSLSCHITGRISSENIILAQGKLVLSKEGLKQLIQEIKGRNIELVDVVQRDQKG